jgi:DNA-binding beta-propeller fold protein YncE
MAYSQVEETNRATILPATSKDYSVSTIQVPADLPSGLPICISADGKGNIFLLRRLTDTPVIVVDPQGKIIRYWGNREFGEGAHGIHVDRDGFVWVTDRIENVIYKFTAEGKLLMTLGKRGTPGDNTSHDLFNGPSDVFVAPNGDIYVADGYQNSRVVRFNKNGRFVRIIGGTKGKGPGQFDLPHVVVMDSRGRVIVADRTNGRIQVFDQEGKFLEEWSPGIPRPSGMHIDPDDTLWVGDQLSETIVKMKNGKVMETIRASADTRIFLRWIKASCIRLPLRLIHSGRSKRKSDLTGLHRRASARDARDLFRSPHRRDHKYSRRSAA